MRKTVANRELICCNVERFLSASFSDDTKFTLCNECLLNAKDKCFSLIYHRLVILPCVVKSLVSSFLSWQIYLVNILLQCDICDACRYAVHNSGISFTLRKADTDAAGTVTVRTQIGASVIDNIRTLYGSTVANEIIPLECEDGKLKLKVIYRSEDVCRAHVGFHRALRLIEKFCPVGKWLHHQCQLLNEEVQHSSIYQQPSGRLYRSETRIGFCVPGAFLLLVYCLPRASARPCIVICDMFFTQFYLHENSCRRN